MFKIRNDDVIDMEKYTPIKKSDNEFKIEKFDGVDVLILDSDEETENKSKLPSCRNLQRELVFLPNESKNVEDQFILIPSSSSIPTTLPSHNKFRQQTLAESFKTNTKLPSKETSQQKPFAEQWKEVRRRLRSPSFKTKVVRDALIAYDKNGPKQRGPKGSIRCTTPETSEFIKSNPYFQELSDSNGKNGDIGKEKVEVSKYGYPKTPPRYWDIDFPSTSEQQELGMVVEADSPLFKKHKK